MMGARIGMTERVLSNSASGVTGAVPVLVVLLGFILLGSFDCSVSEYEQVLDQLVELAPTETPVAVQRWQDETAARQARQARPQELQLEEIEFAIPQTGELEKAQLKAIQTPALVRRTQAGLPQRESLDEPLPTAGLAPVPRGEQLVGTTVSRRENSLAGHSTEIGAGAGPEIGGSELARGGPAAGTGTAAVQVSGTGATGAGLQGRMNVGRQALLDWVLQNQAGLPAVIRTALAFDGEHDITALGQLQDEAGQLHELFFLYRESTNLLRVLVVRGEDAFLIDLPGFLVEARHLQAGGVSRTTAQRGRRIYRVDLQSVSEVTPEMRRLMTLVLEWLGVEQ